MNGLDLFSGIGGLTKALEGYSKPVAYCENDCYCQGVLLSRMGNLELPSAPIWTDVRTLNASLLPGGIDIIYGGFPCQDISVAGRGAGLAGERSGLFFEVARLVSEIRPRFVFLENVPAINRRGGNTVVGTLADLGYDARWDVLSAADVGANHLRERWWLLAHAGSQQHKGPGDEIQRQTTKGLSTDMAYAESRARQRPPPGKAGHASLGGKNVANTAIFPERKPTNQADAIAGSGDARPKFSGGSRWSTEPNVGRVANGVPLRVDRLRGLGNAVVPAQAREAFERLMGLK